MKTILFFVVLLGSILYASAQSDDEKQSHFSADSFDLRNVRERMLWAFLHASVQSVLRSGETLRDTIRECAAEHEMAGREDAEAFSKKIRDKIKKEVRANVTALIGELNAALDKHVAIADDKSKSTDEKIKDLLKLRQENPKVYNVLWAMFEKFIPSSLPHKSYENLNEAEKTEMDKVKMEVRAKVRKLTGELSAMLDRRNAILDDKSKTHEQKVKALWALRMENPNANDILYYAFAQFFSKRGLYEKLAITLSKQSNEIEKMKERIINEIRAKLTKLIRELNAAMDRQIAIIDDKSKTFEEKSKALRELRKGNPKVYEVLRAIYEQFTPSFRHLGKIFKRLNDTEKEKVSEALKEVRANVTKLIREASAVFDKGAAILDDNSKTPKEKMKALWELGKENSKANDILNVAIDQFIPKSFRPILSHSHRRRHKRPIEMADFNEIRDEIKKEVRANVTKLIAELNLALDKHIAIADDKSRSLDEKVKDLLKLRQENPKVYHVLWEMFEKFIPPRLFYKRHENLNEAEKAEIDEAKKNVRAKIRRLTSEMNAMLDKTTAILDDKSRTHQQKLKALWELRKENPNANDILDVTFAQFLSKRKLYEKLAFMLSKQSNKDENAIWELIIEEVRTKVAKLIGELSPAMDRQIAIVDDKSKTFKEKSKALWELRKGNPKVYNVLWAMYEQFTPKFRHLGKIFKKLNVTEKEKVSEALKEVRANVTKLIGDLSAVLDKGTAIVDDNSKTPEEKMKALWELSKENSKANDIINVAIDQFIPKRFRAILSNIAFLEEEGSGHHKKWRNLRRQGSK